MVLTPLALEKLEAQRAKRGALLGFQNWPSRRADLTLLLFDCGRADENAWSALGKHLDKSCLSQFRRATPRSFYREILARDLPSCEDQGIRVSLPWNFARVSVDLVSRIEDGILTMKVCSKRWLQGWKKGRWDLALTRSQPCQPPHLGQQGMGGRTIPQLMS